MTIEVLGTFDSKMAIRTVSGARRLDPLRKAHHPGDTVRIVFTDEVENAHEKAFRAFHVYRDEWAARVGYEPEYAKALLKYKYGITIPYVEGFRPPVEWTRGAFFEVDGKIVYAKSTTLYTADELGRLIEGVLKEMSE